LWASSLHRIRALQFVSSMQEGSTPLWFAALHGHFEVVRLLVEKGAEVDRANNVRRRRARRGG
jgi:hypothetical protein